MLEIKPYEFVGLIPFGINRNDLHSLIGQPSKSFMKMETSTQPTDKYNDLSLFIYYNDEEKVSAVESWPDCNIWFLGIDLFKQPHLTLLNFFKKYDENLKMETDGFTSLKAGISTWYEGEISDSVLCSSIFVFEKNYFSS